MTDSRRSATALEIRGLTKTFGGTRALNDLSFSLREGEIFGFVGSNGAGKTTTMRIVLGVLSADSGEVLWNGGPLDLEARRWVGYMPEERGLYPKMRVGDQLQYLAQLHGLDPRQAREATEQWTERLGLSSRLQDEVQTLSLGNQQRVQLAAALVHDPRLLVLDEPFSGLDPVAVDVMSSVLRECADEGVPVIFSSHQLELVERLSDRVGIVARGEMVAVGTIAELRQTGASLRHRRRTHGAAAGRGLAALGARSQHRGPRPPPGRRRAPLAGHGRAGAAAYRPAQRPDHRVHARTTHLVGAFPRSRLRGPGRREPAREGRGMTSTHTVLMVARR